MPSSSLSPQAQAAVEAFGDSYEHSPDGVWFAPGRVNLIGEHTDYNDGFCLPFALPQGTVAAGGRRDTGRLRARSLQKQEPLDIALDDITPAALSGWGAYVGGVAWALRSEGHEIDGLDLVVSGDVPPGAGLSSSHSLECATATACNDLFDLGQDQLSLAKLVRRTENELVGAPTGIMDQTASLFSRVGHLTFLDCRSLDVEFVPFDPGAHDLAILVVDTRTPHSLVEGEYAKRRRSCEEGASALGVPALRDVSLDDLDGALRRMDDDVLRRRVRHIVTENARVLQVAGSLRDGADPREIGPALTASHVSMRDDFEITVPQVDTAVEALLGAGAHGARMTGGGFGGCVIGLVESSAVLTAMDAVEEAYRSAEFRAPAAFVATPQQGAHRLA